MHTHIILRAGRRTLSAALTSVIACVGLLLPSVAAAASSWNPTLLVNTESFDTIDAGDGSTDIELRFGTSTKTIKFLTTSEFQFSHSISVLGNMSGTSLHVDKDATFGAGVTASGTIRGVGNIRAQGTLSGNALNVNQQGTFGGSLTASGTIRGVGNIRAQGTLSGNALNVNRNGTFGNNLTASGTITGVGNIRALGTLSGNALNINQQGHFGGALFATGAIQTQSDLTINGDNGAVDAVLTFGHTAAATLTHQNSRLRFQFSKSISVLGTISGSALNVDRNATIGGSLTVSGSSYVRGSIFATGSIIAEGALSGSTFYGAGLGDCSNTTTQKLVYDKATGRFTCATDQTGAGSFSSGGILSFHPQYPNAIYFASGSTATTVGQLTQSGGLSASDNTYTWTSTRATIQDYWIATRVRVPDNFSAWDPVQALELRYRTTDATAGNNHVTIRVKDTNDAFVTLTNSDALASATLATSRIKITSGTFTPKDYFTIYIKLAALTGKTTEVGFLNMNFETTIP